MRSGLVTAAGCFAALLAAAGCTRTPDPARPKADEDPGVDLERAALPFKILELPGGREIGWEAFVDRVRQVSALCVGEQHSNPHHHWAQLQAVEAVFAGGEGEYALGMEMFQRPFQGVLDDYAAGRIEEGAMLARTGWDERWGYDYGLYRPMVDAALQEGAALVALNATRELVRKVSRKGLDALTRAEREALPELDLDDEDHQAWFWDVMESLGDAHGHGAGARDASVHGEAEGHGTGGPDAAGHRDTESAESANERLYAAQVIWDETMAEAAADWLAGGESRRIVLLTGNGHCHESAVVSRIERRGDYEAASVVPILDTSGGDVADHLANPRHDFLFVMTPPETAGP